MAWRGGLLLLVLALSCAGGCTQTSVLCHSGLTELRQGLEALPAAQEAKPDFDPVPAVPSPATVNHLDRLPRYLSLAEAIAVALEQGNVGSASARSPGLANEDLVSFTGGGVAGSDAVRVLALEPAIAAARVESELARFDAAFFSDMRWRTTDEPTQGLSNFQNGQAATLSTGLAKPLPTGGVTGINMTTDYNYLKDPPGGPFTVLNPSYFTRLQLGFEQPLLRNNGVLLNQLLERGPESSLFPAVSGRFGTGQGILLARLRFDQQRAELERRINHLLLNVEVAYWNLYGAYVNLYSTEQGMRMATEVWRIAKEQFPVTVDESAFAGARGQYQLFRGNRLQAVGRVLEAERTLRQLLGLPVEDGQRLVPVDTPMMTPYLPDWDAALRDALERRPELVLARQDIKARQFRLATQLNQLAPDLRFRSTYTVVGLGSRLDGSGTFLDANGDPVTNNALRSLLGSHYNNWEMGLSLNMPIGFRQEHAAVRQARLELAQGYRTLKEQEVKAQTFLARQYSRLVELAEVIEARREQRNAYAKQVEIRFSKFAAGKIEVDFLQSAVQQWTSALANEYQAIVEYNEALATFQFARGTLMSYDNVVISEGALPAYAQVRAVEHERQRSRAVALLERANPVPHPPCSVETNSSGLPELPTFEPANVPALMELAKAPPRSLEQVIAVQTASAKSEVLAAPAETPVTAPVMVAPQPEPLPVVIPGAVFGRADQPPPPRAAVPAPRLDLGQPAIGPTLVVPTPRWGPAAALQGPITRATLHEPIDPDMPPREGP